MLRLARKRSGSLCACGLCAFGLAADRCASGGPTRTRWDSGGGTGGTSWSVLVARGPAAAAPGGSRGRPAAKARRGIRPGAGSPPVRRRGAAAEEPGAPAGHRQPKLGFVPLSTLFLVLLVGHKCAVDGLSRFTRIQGVSYSATTAAILGEVIKIPVLLIAILVFEGRAQLLPILKSAVYEKPLALSLPGLAYSAQNILYFQALSHLSAAGYQILSQSKLLFTGFFMSAMLNNKPSRRQYLSLVLLMLGTIITQLSEMSRSTVTGGNALVGGLLTLVGAALSALPNVYYEKVLKTEGQNQWSKNAQLTFWIWFWLIIISIPSIVGPQSMQLPAGTNMMTGITGWVWLVVVLQSFKCLLIPATLKYADNILYAYVKPASILLTAICATAVSGILPSGQFLGGAALVFASMWLYGS